MKRAVAISFAVAALFHAWLLFGFRLGTAATVLAVSDEPSAVDVNLLASSDSTESSAPPQESPAQQAPTAEPTPTPSPEPTPEAAPSPDATTPDPAPTPVPSPTPEPSRLASKPATSPQPHSLAKAKPGAVSQSPAAHGNSKTGSRTGAKPRYRSNPRPDYPIEARRNHQEGVVTLNVEVGADGLPKDIALKQSSGVPALDHAAIQAVRHWQFDPAMADGLPVTSRVDIPVRFSLGELPP